MSQLLIKVRFSRGKKLNVVRLKDLIFTPMLSYLVGLELM